MCHPMRWHFYCFILLPTHDQLVFDDVFYIRFSLGKIFSLLLLLTFSIKSSYVIAIKETEKKNPVAAGLAVCCINSGRCKNDHGTSKFFDLFFSLNFFFFFFSTSFQYLYMKESTNACLMCLMRIFCVNEKRRKQTEIGEKYVKSRIRTFAFV